ncbi:ATP-binding protein [Streptomyces sp. NBC_00257]|uniref:ATP-binding protein n=1 Tax=unclassified Streptomyces TaxID=2593676 RepID=UPI00224D5D51|nr:MULTISPECIES: ATP-binding protein [unclassified Streptomyces]MCX4901625.1 ATP-binding protein [Streptomyces sp. NBC_00892]MCX5426867.1 ATP-binding protein [Streptomyces sp. NBC_00062]
MTAPAPAAPRTAHPVPLRPGSFEVAFVPGLDRIAQMRRITAVHLRYWQVPESLRPDIILVVSELVTNAVVHGRGQVGLRIGWFDDRVRIEVTDENPAPARLRRATDDDMSGRGMHIVDALAQTWGVSNGGRTTWCVIAAGGDR